MSGAPRDGCLPMLAGLAVILLAVLVLSGLFGCASVRPGAGDAPYPFAGDYMPDPVSGERPAVVVRP